MIAEKLLKLTKRFQKLAQWGLGRDYIRQKPDGTLYIDGVQVDRDDLNAMNSWQDLVDLGVDRGIVGRIARDYGGDPRHVDVWLENNSKPYIEEGEEDAGTWSSGKDYRQMLASAKRRSFGQPWSGTFDGFQFGKYKISVQGGRGNYSSPRQDLDNLTDYEELEIAMMDDSGWALPSTHDDLADMPHADVYSGDDVAGYVPIDKVIDIMEYLDKIS